MDGMDGLAGGQFYHRHEPFSGFGQFETGQRQPFSWRFGGGTRLFCGTTSSLASLWVMPGLLFGYVLAA